MQPAPFFTDIADGPSEGAAFWLTAEDGVRVRMAVWGREAEAGTVLLFTGRTEYAEKYGRAARDFLARGFATVAVDWRGQGLADRLHDDPVLGHIDSFDAYQRDVAAMVSAAGALGLPQPYFLLAHSMGGAIGLRALYEGLDVAAAAFSAPMWGINFSPLVRPVAWALSAAGRTLGFGLRFTPGTSRETYVLANAFDSNGLTADPGMFDYMRAQVTARPELSVSGPSLIWLHEALRETSALARRPAPAHPALTFLGSDESIVSAAAIELRMADWADGTLRRLDGARHEVMMETPAVRAQVFDEMAAFFTRHRATQRPLQPCG